VATTGLDRARAGAFFGDWLDARESAEGAADAGRLVVERLLDAAYDVAPAKPVRRRLAMSTAGAPVVYSHKLADGGRAPAFRMLAEPGGIGIGVAEQVALSRRLLGGLLADLGWLGAAEPLDAVVELLIPAEPGALDDWHGGLGLGVEVGDAGPELRVYCNVRHGELTGRWQRLLDVVGEFADARAVGAVVEMLDIAIPRAVPAGLAVAIGAGQVRGIRLYAGLLDATAESAVAAAPDCFADSAPPIARLVDSYRAAFGELGTQGLTLAYDFALVDGLLWPAVARYKVDLFCEPASGHGTAALLDWIDPLARSLGLAPAGLRRFASDLDRHFPGWTFQYLSLGCRDGTRELSAYCVPGRAGEPVGDG
jgi:hypothetical protein